MIRRSRSIAEYAIRKWILDRGMEIELFDLSMEGRKGVLTDKNGDTITLVYDSGSREVFPDCI